MREKAIEVAEEAQKASITEPYTLLDNRGKKEIGLIDLALNKIVLGEYGVCESCGDDISIKRLDALPWARMCIECTREYERKRKTLPPTAELIGTGKLPAKYRGFSGKRILALINETLSRDTDLEIDGLTISFQNGVIHLEGTVAGEYQHQVILQTLTDVMEFTAILDHLEVEEHAKRKAGGVAVSSGSQRSSADRLIEDQEDMTEDMLDSQDDEIPYKPADQTALYPAHR
jgi:RNA polymerase-binding transcription factor DksA